MVREEDRLSSGFSEGRPWLPVPAEHAALSVSRQVGRADSMLEHYKRFIAFRAEHPALAKGAIRFLPMGDPNLLVLVREKVHLR
jgi:alpha-glucosidase